MKFFHIGRLFFIVFFLGNLLTPVSAAAVNNPFGGLIINKTFCNCSGNWIITLQTPKSGLPRDLSFDFGSILYEFMKMRVGEQVLGTWEGAAQCLHITSHGCVPKFVSGKVVFPRIFMVGTSGGQLDSTPPPEEEKPQCSDGRDNDGDGKTDYPGDPGCDSPNDSSEGDPQCSDGRDNDGDGKTDYPDDDGCESDEDNSETLEPCSCNCSDGKSEEETRSELAAGGIEINKSPCPRENENNPCESTKTGTNSEGKAIYSCTDVRCLPQIAIDGLIELKRKSQCPVMITGGTEPGHKTHAQCKPVVDLRIDRSGETLNGCVDKYIAANAESVDRSGSTGPVYYLNLDVGRTRFIDERIRNYPQHWHVIFDGTRMPQNLNKCLAKQYIIANEGWKNEPYTDSRGFPTVGVGHKLDPGDSYNRTLTNEEVGDLFEQDFPKYERLAKNTAAPRGVQFESLSEGRQIVLIDMAFNMGSGNGEGLDDFDKMWTAIDNEQWDIAGDEIMDSEYAGQVGDRASRNAEMMRDGGTGVAERRVNDVQKAKDYDCGA